MSSSITEPPPVALPPVVQSQADQPIRPQGSWRTIVPAYLGVFVWVPFLDVLGSVGRDAGGTATAFLGAALAVLAGYALLYDLPARPGSSTGRRLPVVASAALGAEGSEWIAGVHYGFFGLVWTATAIYYSVKLILLGLLSWDLIDVSAIQRGSLGGLPLESPVFLVCLVFWTLIIFAVNRLRLMTVITALMKAYAPIAGLLLAIAAAWAWAHPPALVVSAVRPSPNAVGARVFQLVFSYFAFAGLMGVEWGSAVRDRRDLRIGGWLGILGAGAVASLSALVLSASDPGAPTEPGALNWDLPSGSFQGAVYRGLTATAGDRAAGLVLLLFGVAALAPACYGSALFSNRFRTHWPMMRGRAGLSFGFLAVFLLGATALSAELETLFTISGALFAPLAGVLAAEAARSRGVWAGVRRGWRPSGVSAWSLGAVVGLSPVLQGLPGASILGSIPTPALLGYVAAALCHLAAGLAERRGGEVAVGRPEKFENA